MTDPNVPVPETKAETRAAAGERSWRTFLQGMGIDVGVAVVLVISAAVGNLDWSTAFWTSLLTSVGKTVVQTAVAYLMRVFVKPRQEVPA